MFYLQRIKFHKNIQKDILKWPYFRLTEFTVKSNCKYHNNIEEELLGYYYLINTGRWRQQ